MSRQLPRRSLGRATLLALVVAGAVWPRQAAAFEFLCNGWRITGFDGSGCPSGFKDVPGGGDCSCGNNNGAAAPKWFGAQLSMRVENDGGNGVTASQFVGIVEDTFAAWNDVSCSLLQINNGGTFAPANAVFGDDSNVHGIWFVKTNNEWMAASGSGAGGTLGVTLAPWFSSSCSNREFYDADIMINGFVQFGWSAADLEGTVLHEVGHAIGLGHPCLIGPSSCSNSCSAVMAASGGDFSVPQQDDVNGVCALYPGTPGGLGSACDSPSDCTGGKPCITYQGFSYCSQTCGTCPTGYDCRLVDSQNVCTRKGAPAVGEACTGSCESGALCVESICRAQCNPASPVCDGADRCVELSGGGGVCWPPGTQQVGELCGGPAGECSPGNVCLLNEGSTTTGTCYKECNPTQAASCGVSTEICLNYDSSDANAGICLTAAAENGDCDATDSLCVANNICVGEPEGARCRRECDPAVATSCPPGYGCLGLQNGGGACFPQGDNAEGEACFSPNDCTSGATCVLTGGANDAAACFLICNPTNPFCPHQGQSCLGLQGADEGVCDPPGGGGGGGGCTCNTTTGTCDTNCICDPDCATGCQCDVSTSCTANCACDTDCATTCGCDTSDTCQAGCACDPDCRNPSCACDAGIDCTLGCSCDPQCLATCPAGFRPACDLSTACDPDATSSVDNWVDCPCDPECPCLCDATSACDANCACDFDCFTDTGCGCNGNAGLPGFGIIGLSLIVGRWRRRKLH